MSQNNDVVGAAVPTPQSPGAMHGATLHTPKGSPDQSADPPPWPDPVNGGELLDQISALVAEYVVLPDGGADAIALFVVHSYALDAADTSPILAVTSPIKRCGKTTLLALLEALVRKPVVSGSLTPSVVFRMISQHHPTLLIDEADTFLSRSEELRGVLNSSHTRSSAYVWRSSGKQFEPTQFSTWCCKTIALIGTLPDTLQDRSIEIKMMRRLPGELVRRLSRRSIFSDTESLRRQLARWAADHHAALAASDPELPNELHDRAQDNWRPLIAIADVVKGPWPNRAREAARRISGRSGDDADTNGTLLLGDLRDYFDRIEGDIAPSAEFVETLGTMEERPWPEFRSGKPITVVQVAALLKPFNIVPKKRRVGHDTIRGYDRRECDDAFRRYAPRAGVRPGTSPVTQLPTATVPGVPGVPRVPGNKLIRAKRQDPTS